MSKVFTAGVVLAIAMVAHSANAAWCEHLGDHSQVPWADAPEDLRASVAHGVEFHLLNPDAGDNASHEEWMKFKLADGWTYGETKDFAKKTHPCLVEFDKLPPEHQFKDRLFRTLVHATYEVLAPAFDAAVALKADQAQLEADLAGAREALVEANGTITKLQAEIAKPSRTPASASTARKPRSEKARKCGPMDPVDSGTLGELLKSGTHEIVFSNGKTEIIGLEPVVATPDAWLRHANGWLLEPNITVDGPQKGSPPFEVKGFGLFDSGGKQIAYSALHEPVRIAPGLTCEFRRSIIF